ncbi:hypothetical protein A2Z33_01450 [Candidatus Gottesmanbacteria bacterium RBG_16_52_11]|uniref:Uncharacterized protein n=1 Tax=Candidatus Gottesmanbacteria bacterium RBG_16_52_11 TaxID=1798374 RepID=A0A1F5YNW6_9BACT|nr:MAG: hypothetical protein A2Z33_01450 [Candidatus Gottesmanbacteria bacterium RBG_16_52_11]
MTNHRETGDKHGRVTGLLRDIGTMLTEGNIDGRLFVYRDMFRGECGPAGYDLFKDWLGREYLPLFLENGSVTVGNTVNLLTEPAEQAFLVHLLETHAPGVMYFPKDEMHSDNRPIAEILLELFWAADVRRGSEDDFAYALRLVGIPHKTIAELVSQPAAGSRVTQASRRVKGTPVPA